MSKMVAVFKLLNYVDFLKVLSGSVNVIFNVKENYGLNKFI